MTLFYLLSITYFFEVPNSSVHFFFVVHFVLNELWALARQRNSKCLFVCVSVFVCVCDPFSGFFSFSLARLFLQLHSLHNEEKKKNVYKRTYAYIVCITLWVWWHRSRYDLFYMRALLFCFIIIKMTTISFFLLHSIFNFFPIVLCCWWRKKRSDFAHFYDCIQ